MATISTLVPSCLRGFKSLDSLLTGISGPGRGNDNLPGDFQPSVKNELGRFRVWSTNLGAHRTGKSSLDYRLRDASNIRTQVINLLNDLLECLQDATSIANGTVGPLENTEPTSDDEESDSDSDGSGTQAPSDVIELSQIVSEASEIINCLFRLSVSIHNPAPHDRFRRSALTDTSHFEAFDTAHIGHKFPYANEGIVKQLGKANSFRRQFFRYREEHHRKLAHGLPDEDTEQPGRDDTKTVGVTTVASSLPQHLKTSNADVPGLENCDARSEAGQTETSFAPSSVPDGGRSRVPLMPGEAGQGPFECPFCYRMISVDTTKEWRKHVLGDLRPYICLYPDCSAAGQDFQRRHQWIQHVQQAHWKILVCPFGCEDLHLDNISALDAHVTTSHKDFAQTVSRESLIQLSKQERPLDAAKTCELCNEELDSFKSYSRHVGRHQEDLALFVLPDRGLDADTDEEEGFGEDEKPEDAAGGSSDHARMDQDEGTGSFTRSPVSVSSDQGLLPNDEDEELLETPVQDEAHNNPEVGAPNQAKRGAVTCNICKLRGLICNGEEPCRQCTQTPLQCSYGPLPMRAGLIYDEWPGLEIDPPQYADLNQESDVSTVDKTNIPPVASPDGEQSRIPISSPIDLPDDLERRRKQVETYYYLPDPSGNSSPGGATGPSTRSNTHAKGKAVGKEEEDTNEPPKKQKQGQGKQPVNEDEGAINFTDAIGRRFTFPFRICRTWQEIIQLIEKAHGHTEFKSQVLQGHYDLISPYGEVILLSDWDRVIKPGWHISMRMWPTDSTAKQPVFATQRVPDSTSSIPPPGAETMPQAQNPRGSHPTSINNPSGYSNDADNNPLYDLDADDILHQMNSPLMMPYISQFEQPTSSLNESPDSKPSTSFTPTSNKGPEVVPEVKQDGQGTDVTAEGESNDKHTSQERLQRQRWKTSEFKVKEERSYGMNDIKYSDMPFYLASNVSGTPAATSGNKTWEGIVKEGYYYYLDNVKASNVPYQGKRSSSEVVDDLDPALGNKSATPKQGGDNSRRRSRSRSTGRPLRPPARPQTRAYFAEQGYGNFPLAEGGDKSRRRPPRYPSLERSAEVLDGYRDLSIEDYLHSPIIKAHDRAFLIGQERLWAREQAQADEQEHGTVLTPEQDADEAQTTKAGNSSNSSQQG